MEDALAVSSIVCSGLLPLSRRLSDDQIDVDPYSILRHVKTNGHVILHLINAVLMYWICKILLRRLRNYNSNDNIKYALIAPILFNLHPVHTTTFNEPESLTPYLSLCFGLLTLLLYFIRGNGLKTNIVCLILGTIFLYTSNTFTWQGTALVIAYSQSKSRAFILSLIFLSYFYFTQMRHNFSFDYVQNLRIIFSSTVTKCSASRLSVAAADALIEFATISGTENSACASATITSLVAGVLLLVTALCGVSKIEVNGNLWQVVSCGLITIFFINYTYITSRLIDSDTDSSGDMTTKRYISLSVACTVVGFVITDIKRLLTSRNNEPMKATTTLAFKAPPMFAWALHVGVECILLALVLVTVQTLLRTNPAHASYLPQYIVKFVK